MLGSGIIDFAIGIVFTFLAMSLAAGAATEALSSAFKIRSKKLLQGIKDLLNESDANTLAAQLYRNALVNPRGGGGDSSTEQKPPAYIHAEQFAAAFVEIIKGPPNNQAVQAPAAPAPAPAPPAPAPAAAPDPAALQQHQIQDLKSKVDVKVPPGRNDQIRNLLHGMIDRAKGDEEQVRKQLAEWFDNSMDRVSGAYKRWTQLWSFIFAFLIAAILNVSTIDIAQSLWRHPVDTKAMEAAKPDTDLQTVLKSLETLPIGWPTKELPATGAAAAKPGGSTTTPGGSSSTIGSTATPGSAATTPPAASSTPAPAANSGVTKPAGGETKAAGKPQNIFEFIADPSLMPILGWLITAFATLFGAPFWFDTLQQITRLKGSGPSPANKKQQAASQ